VAALRAATHPESDLAHFRNDSDSTTTQNDRLTILGLVQAAMLTKFSTLKTQNRVRNLKPEQNLARFNFLGIFNFVEGGAPNKIVDLNRQPIAQKKAESLIFKTLVVCTTSCYTKILRKSRSKFE
jgi:hypothetical protein